jgi:hypothetical protein
MQKPSLTHRPAIAAETAHGEWPALPLASPPVRFGINDPSPTAAHCETHQRPRLSQRGGISAYEGANAATLYGNWNVLAGAATRRSRRQRL